jgi:hypothetical protein
MHRRLVVSEPFLICFIELLISLTNLVSHLLLLGDHWLLRLNWRCRSGLSSQLWLLLVVICPTGGDINLLILVVHIVVGQRLLLVDSTNWLWRNKCCVMAGHRHSRSGNADSRRLLLLGWIRLLMMSRIGISDWSPVQIWIHRYFGWLVIIKQLWMGK